MSDQAISSFRAGRNIAMKVPPHQFDATVDFYKRVIGLPHLKSEGNSECFSFGAIHLWIDRVSAVSQAEIWLEVQSDNTEKAAKTLDAAGITRCDEIEPLPEEFDGFWIANPAGIVHLVNHPKEDSNSSGDT
jgi:hypothetical protein